MSRVMKKNLRSTYAKIKGAAADQSLVFAA